METLQRTANRGSVSTGFDIDNSLKLEADNSEYLHYTPSSQTDYERMVFSVWIKRTELGTTQTLAEFGNGTADTTQLRIGFDTSDRLFCYGNSTIWRQTNRLFRDTAAWYHLFFLFDTTTPGGVSNNRVRIWVNGEMIDHTDFGVINNPGSGSAMGFNKTNQQSLGTQDEDGPKNYFCGYIAQAYGSGGTPPVVGDFGETDSDTGIWKPIDISGITPPDANGFNLDFSDSSDLGNDISSRNNDFTLVNIAAADQSTDTPTNNFCTLNPIVNFKYTTNGITEGATTFGDNTGGGVGGAFGTMAVTAGKWYWEMKLVQQSAHYPGVSAVDDGDNVLSSSDPQEENSTFRFNIGAARREYVSGGSQTYGSLDEFSDFHSAGDIIGIALNMDDNQISIYGNGTLQSGVANSSLADAANKMVVPFHATINDTVQYNFGGYSAWTPSSAVNDENGYGTFEYAPPSGYYALCTKNLAEFGG